MKHRDHEHTTTEISISSAVKLGMISLTIYHPFLGWLTRDFDPLVPGNVDLAISWINNSSHPGSPRKDNLVSSTGGYCSCGAALRGVNHDD